MPLYQDNIITIYFGDSSDQLFMNDNTYDNFQKTSELLAIAPFSCLRDTMHIEHFMFPRQVHGTSGFVVDATSISAIKPFSIQGDYIITNRPGIGIGVLTADCLPILLHDTVNQSIAIIHAGWRGSVAGIAIKALEHMSAAFGTAPTNVRVFFGPAAGQCCYSVGQELIEAIKPDQEQVLAARNNQVYFDLAGYNQLLLQKAGVPTSALYMDYAQCTICHDQFYSYRRQNKLAGRQMTVACIKSKFEPVT